MNTSFYSLDLVNSRGQKVTLHGGCYAVWAPRDETLAFFDERGNRIYHQRNKDDFDDKAFVPQIANKDELITRIIDPMAQKCGLSWQMSQTSGSTDPDRPLTFVFRGQ
jgi:hypothetical protein